jgi:hypothetical protein
VSFWIRDYAAGLFTPIMAAGRCDVGTYVIEKKKLGIFP